MGAATACPEDPRAWLIRVASRRLIDRSRADGARAAREEAVAVAQPADALTAPPPGDERPDAADDGLLLLLLCCHPSLSRASQVALTLRAVSGLGTAEIAAAFLVPERTMAQRLSRARATLRDAGARFELPAPPALPDRVAAVLDVLHLVFNEGYTRSAGDTLLDTELTREAIRLTRELSRRLPAHDEVAGALALMLLTRAREAARTDGAGDLVPLARAGPEPLGRRVDRRGHRDPRAGAPARARRAVPAAGRHRGGARGGPDVGGDRLGADLHALRDARARGAGPGGHAQPGRRGGDERTGRSTACRSSRSCSPTRRCGATTAPTRSARTCSRWPATATRHGGRTRMPPG